MKTLLLICTGGLMFFAYSIAPRAIAAEVIPVQVVVLPSQNEANAFDIGLRNVTTNRLTFWGLKQFKGIGLESVQVQTSTHATKTNHVGLNQTDIAKLRDKKASAVQAECIPYVLGPGQTVFFDELKICDRLPKHGTFDVGIQWYGFLYSETKRKFEEVAVPPVRVRARCE